MNSENDWELFVLFTMIYDGEGLCYNEYKSCFGGIPCYLQDIVGMYRMSYCIYLNAILIRYLVWMHKISSLESSSLETLIKIGSGYR
jgi:hypothetical protein